VSKNTRNFFISLDICQEFLREDPSTWDNSETYKNAQRKVHSIKVVNDTAERDLGLIESFNAVQSNQEEQKQFLLQVVVRHVQEFPNLKKATATSN